MRALAWRKRARETLLNAAAEASQEYRSAFSRTWCDQRKTRQRGLAQIVVQEAVNTVVDDITRAHDMMCSNAYATCERFENDEPEGLCARWKYEGIHRSTANRQVLGRAVIAEEDRLSVEACLQALSLGPVADDSSVPGKSNFRNSSGFSRMLAC